MPSVERSSVAWSVLFTHILLSRAWTMSSASGILAAPRANWFILIGAQALASDVSFKGQFDEDE